MQDAYPSMPVTAGDQANAKTPLSETPTSTRRDLTRNIGPALPNPEGDRQGDGVQPIAGVAHPLLNGFPRAIRGYLSGDRLCRSLCCAGESAKSSVTSRPSQGIFTEVEVGGGNRNPLLEQEARGIVGAGLAELVVTNSAARTILSCTSPLE
jgi:hypothetical protein